MSFQCHHLTSLLSELEKIVYTEIGQTSGALSLILQIESEGCFYVVSVPFFKQLVDCHYRFLLQQSRNSSLSIFSLPAYRFVPSISTLPDQQLTYWMVWKASVSCLIRHRALELVELPKILMGACLSESHSLCDSLCAYFLKLIQYQPGWEGCLSYQNVTKLSDILISSAICSRSKSTFDCIYEILIGLRLKCQPSASLEDRQIHEKLERHLRVGRLVYAHDDFDVQQIYYQLLLGNISQAWVDSLLNVTLSADLRTLPKFCGTLLQIHESLRGPFASLQLTKSIDNDSIKTFIALSSEPSVKILPFPGTGELKASLLADPCYGLASSGRSVYISTLHGNLYSVSNLTIEEHRIQSFSTVHSSHGLCAHLGFLFSANFRTGAVTKIDLSGNIVQEFLFPSGKLPIAITLLGGVVAAIDYLTGSILEVSGEFPRELLSLVDHKSDIFFHSMSSHDDEACILSKGPDGQVLHFYRNSIYLSVNIDFVGHHDWFSVAYLNPHRLLLADYNYGVYLYCTFANKLTKLFRVPDCTNAIFCTSSIYAISESVNAVYVYPASHLC